ncbi:carbamoyltransferase family protein [Streptomyces huasconensis]|uniref:carbamoyltransferase family protein n=1 Tax=Streptomyces huasconensis TaxID=1854574 RepID=UPI0033E540CB
MIILGYNGFSRVAELFGKLYGYTQDSVDRHSFLGHDAAAALFVDGELVAAVEEERMNRQKKTTAFPANAMRWCLDQAGLDYGDVDYYAFGWQFSAEFADDAIGKIAQAPLPPEYKFQAISGFGELYTGAFSKTAILEDFARNTGHTLAEEKLITVPHHRAHLACGRTFAGFGDAAFFISDGQAEQDSAIMGEIRDGRVKVFEEFTIDSANSIAQLFAEVTRYLGFTPNNDEYKVMGLGGFGEPPEKNPFLSEVVSLDAPGRYSLALAGDPRGPRAYLGLFDEIFGGHDGNRGDFDFQVRVASAAQQMLEVVTAHQLTALAEATDLRDLIYEGGVALNCVNNTKLLEDLPFERAEVSFGASDPGVSIGAAAHVAREKNVPLAPANSPYLGPAYTADDIRATLDAYTDSLTWEELPGDEIVTRTAELLSGRTVIGWFQGRTEYGPRALGNRSILANPSHADMKDIINTRVKHREPFRPFAPIVLEEDAPRVFEMGKKERSPYMTFVFPVRPEYTDTIAAATHVDATSRIQTVTDESNPRLARLLREFTARTDVPCLVNTSFNVAGEPIVCSPKDAVACFLGTDIDHLVLGDFLVTKR